MMLSSGIQMHLCSSLLSYMMLGWFQMSEVVLMMSKESERSVVLLLLATLKLRE